MESRCNSNGHPLDWCNLCTPIDLYCEFGTNVESECCWMECMVMLMAWCKAVVSSLLTHRRYCSLERSHLCKPSAQQSEWWLVSVQDCGISSALVIEIPQPCTKPFSLLWCPCVDMLWYETVYTTQKQSTYKYIESMSPNPPRPVHTRPPSVSSAIPSPSLVIIFRGIIYSCIKWWDYLLGIPMLRDYQ